MEIWKASKDIHDQMRDLIGQNHPDLALVSDEILVMFREKARKAGGVTIYGSPKKMPYFTNVVAGTEYKFVLDLAADTWENDLSSRQREALLDQLLTACRCDEDPNTGDLVCSVAKPDMRASFAENVERYGMWWPKEEDEEEGTIATADLDASLKDVGLM